MAEKTSLMVWEIILAGIKGAAEKGLEDIADLKAQIETEGEEDVATGGETGASEE